MNTTEEYTLNDNIPKFLQQKIIEEAKDNKHFSKVFRVAKWGLNDSRNFISTFSEIQKKYIPDSDIKYPKDKIGTYSTSVFTNPKSCCRFIRCLNTKLREVYPHPVILEGKTSQGLVQQTKIRDKNYKDPTHVDWWIYQDKENLIENDFTLFEEEGD